VALRRQRSRPQVLPADSSGAQHPGWSSDRVPPIQLRCRRPHRGRRHPHPWVQPRAKPDWSNVTVMEHPNHPDFPTGSRLKGSIWRRGLGTRW